jgi:hypothetical protein
MLTMGKGLADIKIGCRKMGLEGVNWIFLPQDSMNVMMDVWVPSSRIS